MTDVFCDKAESQDMTDVSGNKIDSQDMADMYGNKTESLDEQVDALTGIAKAVKDRLVSITGVENSLKKNVTGLKRQKIICRRLQERIWRSWRTV